MNGRYSQWVLVFCLTTSAHAAELIRGPSLGFHWVGPARVEEQRSQHPLELTRSTQRREINLMAPLPKALPGGTWVLKFDSFSEIRDLGGRDAASVPLFNRDDVTDVGLIWLTPKPTTNLQPLIGYTYYSDWSANSEAMHEYLVGADIDWLSGTSRVVLRKRAFPGFSEWLFLAGHRRQFSSGFGYDIFIPAQALFYYETTEHDWRFYGGMQWQSREYPSSFRGSHAWWSGNTEKTLLGVRRAIQPPIYVSLELGSLRENLRLKDRAGEELAVWHGRAAPYVRLALEGWIDKP